MYRNLEAEIIRCNISKHDIAKSIGRTYKTLLQKISGKYPFTLDEAMQIHRKYFPDLSFPELFKNDTDQKGA